MHLETIQTCQAGRTNRVRLFAAVSLSAALMLSQPVAASDWDDDPWDDDPWGEDVSPTSWYGFIEGAAGVRTRDNPLIDERMPLGELRGQLEVHHEADRSVWRLKVDATADGVEESLDFDVREAMVSFSVGDSIDVRAGRQALTWGTGDLLFLNDLFPKDWNSFLTGRDDEYLRAPANLIRTTWFGQQVNVDTVWLPVFEADRYVDGVRLAYFDPAAGDLVAAPPKLRGARPDRTLRNSEAALRIYGMVGSQEWALYGYRGYTGQPLAFDPAAERATFARLNALGGSLRGPMAGGLYNLEAAWYDAVNNRDGDDPNQPASELRFLAGYERELVTNVSLGTQYYLEWLQDYDAVRENWPFDSAYRPDEFRHVVTARITWRLMQDNLILGLMSFYSPSDEDYFLRPTARYRISDQLQINVGANLFGGNAPSTFYGQFERDSSVFVRLRYNL